MIVTTFKDMTIGTLFRFAPLSHSVTENDETVWKKTSSRGYTLGNKRRLEQLLSDAKRKSKIYGYKVPRSLPEMHVGSINTRVVVVRSK